LSHHNSSNARRAAKGLWSRILAIGCAALGALQVGAMTRLDSPMITIYQRGKAVTVSPEHKQYAQLLAECERRLQYANNILRLAVDKHTIRQLQKTEVSVEIQYPMAKHFSIAFNQREITVQRLLIPLSGDLAGEISTIFYADDEGYRSGPYRSDMGSEPIAELVKTLGIDW
jgi:hypothetical protein